MSARLIVDREEIARFVNLLFRHAASGSRVSLRCFYDKGEPKEEKRPFKFKSVKIEPDRLNLVSEAVAYAQRCANHPRRVVFAPPIATFRHQWRTRAIDLADVLVISAECDARPREALAKLTAVLGPPTLVMASGGTWTNPETGEVEDKLHAHWRLSRAANTDEDRSLAHHARILARMTAGSDGTADSPVHPMRWAGSWHRKDVAHPRMARIVEINNVEVELHEVAVALEAACCVPIEQKRDPGEPEADIDRLVAALTVIPNPWPAAKSDNDQWWWWAKRIGMPLFAATGGSDEGFRLFDEWSQKNKPKYDAKYTKWRWDHMKRYPPSACGAGTLFYEQAVWWEAYEATIDDEAVEWIELESDHAR